MAISNVLSLLFPSDTLITTTMLQEASQTGVQQLYRTCGTNGMFYKPGVLALSNDENKLLPTVSIVGGSYRVNISAGKGVCTAGYIIENLSTVTENYGWSDMNTIVNTTPYLFAKYVTETTDTIESISILSGTTANVSVEHTQDDFATMFYWSASSTLPIGGDAILIGKLGAGYVFDYSYENRNMALLNVLFTDEVTNPASEIMPSVDELHSIYEFLACRGRDTRSIYNPFGLTDVDISDLGNLVSSLVEIPGIPARSFTSTNGDYLEITQNDVSGNYIDVAAGTFVDADGKFVDVDAITTIAIPSTNTWYYVYAKYLDLVTTGSDHLLKSYEVTTSLGSDPAPVSPKYILGMVRCYYSGPSYIMEIADLRTLLSCRLAAGEAPSAPYNLVLTTGSVANDVTNWNYDLTATYSSETYRNVWIRATWNHALTGDVAYFSVKAIPVDDSTGEEIEDGALVGMFNQIPPSPGSSLPWSPSMSHTFNNVVPGVRYNVYVWAVGHPPAYEKSDAIDDDIVAGFGEQLGPPSGLTLTEVYTTSYEATPTTDATIHRDYKGIKATWGVPAGVASNAVLDYEISIQFGSNVYAYNGTQKEFFYSATEEGTYYVTVRAFDNGGYGGAYASASIAFGDETVPYWAAGDNLALSTGVDKTWIPVGEQEHYSRAYSDVSAHITAVWSAATDAKSGVSFYECAFGPVADPPPSSPSESVTADKIQFSVYAYLTANEYYPASISKTFTGLRIGVRYGLKVRPVDMCGNKGAWSGWETIVAGGAPIAVPTIPSFTVQGIIGGSLLSWTPSVSSVSKFEIYGSPNGAPSVPEDLIAIVDGSVREYWHSSPSLVSTADVSGNITSSYVSGASMSFCVRAIDETTEYVGTVSSIETATPIILDAVTVAAVAREVVTARGNYASLSAAMTSSESSQETIDARQGFSTLGDNLSALARGGISWGYVKTVGKSGCNYTQIQAALDALPDSGCYIIFVMPGAYTEKITTTKGASVGFVGLGKVIIDGSIEEVSGKIVLIDNLTIKPSSDPMGPLVTAALGDNMIIRNSIFDGGTYVNIGTMILTSIDNGLLVDNCIVSYAPASGGRGITIGGAYGEVKNCEIAVNGAATQGGIWLVGTGTSFIRNCKIDSGTGPSIAVGSGTTARIYNNIWKVTPSGAGTIDYAAIDAGTVSNLVDANVNIVIPDDLISNA